MVGIAICGAGKIGRVHLVNLRSLRGCFVPGFWDVEPRCREQVALEFGLASYSSWGALLDDRRVQAVVVATPSSSHRVLAEEAISAGKHVFLEKPLAGTLQDSRDIVAATKATDRIVQVGVCERFNPAYLEAKKAVEEGAIGEIRSVRSSRVAPYEFCDPDWDLGVLDTAAHNLDLIQWLVKRRPLSVFAAGAGVYPEDRGLHCCTILVRYEGGVVASDHIAWVRKATHPLPDCSESEMYLQGTTGAFRIDQTSRPAWRMDGQGFRLTDTIIIGRPDYYGCLRLQLDYFLRAIEGAAPPAATPGEVLVSEQIVLAALESLQSGKEVEFAGLS